MITEVKMSSSGKWPQIVLSRTSDEFLFRLFEIEVPEIAEGIVEIAGVARDPGARAKICVRSLDRNVDPVGACVGMRGSRIQSIVRELRGEKIDIIEWSEDPAVLIARVMTPAKVQNVIVYEEQQSVDLIVADDQLALAIGKRGQNAKLAVKLTQWKINITSESERRAALQESFEDAIAQVEQEEYAEQDDYDDTYQEADVDGEALAEEGDQEYDATSDDAPLDDDEFEEEEDDDDSEDEDEDIDDNDYDEIESPETSIPSIPSESHDFLHSELLTLEGVGERMADQLEDAGFFSVEEIALSSVNELSEVPGVGEKTARKLLAAAQAALAPHE
jgi:N utilization substance protein A